MISAKIKKRFCRRMPIIFFQKQIIYGIFPSSSKYFPSSRKFSIRKYFYSVNDVSLIREFFCKQIFFFDQGIFPQTSNFRDHESLLEAKS